MHGRSGGYDSMIDFFEKTKGSISLFLALIMLPMMTVAGLIVDGARISAAKASLSGAGDLAMNAALSEYDQILYDVYGIFAVSENMEELQNNVSRYFANSIDNTGILNDSDSYTREFINSIFSSFSGDEMEFNNIVDLKADRFTLQGVESSAIGNPKVLERQIVDYGVPPDQHQEPHCAGWHHLELPRCHPPGWRHLRLCKECKGPVFCCRR